MHSAARRLKSSCTHFYTDIELLLQIRGNVRAKREEVLGLVSEGLEKHFGVPFARLYQR